MNEDFNKPIECKVCGRITFDQDASVCEIVPATIAQTVSGSGAATGCGWPLKDDAEAHANAYGFDALVQFTKGGIPSHQQEMHRKGKASRVRAAARAEGGTVLALRPLTEAQWINAYGEGRM